MFDLVFGAGAVFKLDFFLGPVIIFLHIHENGPHPGQPGRNKSRWEVKSAGCSQACGNDQGNLYLAGRLNLIGKAELIQRMARGFDGSVYFRYD